MVEFTANGNPEIEKFIKRIKLPSIEMDIESSLTSDKMFYILDPKLYFKKDLHGAENMLLEAIQFDPANDRASLSLKQVRDLIRQLSLFL